MPFRSPRSRGVATDPWRVRGTPGPTASRYRNTGRSLFFVEEVFLQGLVRRLWSTGRVWDIRRKLPYLVCQCLGASPDWLHIIKRGKGPPVPRFWLLATVTGPAAKTPSTPLRTPRRGARRHRRAWWWSVRNGTMRPIALRGWRSCCRLGLRCRSVLRCGWARWP